MRRGQVADRVKGLVPSGVAGRSKHAKAGTFADVEGGGDVRDRTLTGAGSEDADRAADVRRGTALPGREQ